MKPPHRRQFLHLVGGTAALPAVSRIAAPQAYPSRPITLLVPFPPAGANDINGAVYELKYDVLNDFEPVSLVATQPFLVVAKKAMPADDLKGLIAWLKINGHLEKLISLPIADSPGVNVYESEREQTGIIRR